MRSWFFFATVAIVILAYAQASCGSRAECSQGFQPWDGGCVSNQRVIEENLWGEIAPRRAGGRDE
jgi:hypothetical protein